MEAAFGKAVILSSSSETSPADGAKKVRSRPFAEVLASLLDCHQEFLLDDLGRRRALGSEGELEVADDFVDDLRVFDEGDDAHLAAAEGTERETVLS